MLIKSKVTARLSTQFEMLIKETQFRLTRSEKAILKINNNEDM